MALSKKLVVEFLALLVFTYFPKVVHIELADEGGEVGVLEIEGKNFF